MNCFLNFLFELFIASVFHQYIDFYILILYPTILLSLFIILIGF